jgi:hypothetical protein
MAFSRPEREMPFFFSSSEASLAFLMALARSATLKLSDDEDVPGADLEVELGASLSASVRIRPAVSMSSRRTTQRRGSEVKSWPRSSSVRVGSRRLIT